MTRPRKGQYRRGDIVADSPCRYGIATGEPHSVEPYPFYSVQRTFCEAHKDLQRQVRANPETGELELVTEDYSLGSYTATKSYAFRTLAKWGRWWHHQNRLPILTRPVRPSPSSDALLAGVPDDGSDPYEWEADPHPQYVGDKSLKGGIVMRIATKHGRLTYRKNLIALFMGRQTVRKGVSLTSGTGLDHTGAGDEEALLTEEHGPDSTVGLWQHGEESPKAQRPEVPQQPNDVKRHAPKERPYAHASGDVGASRITPRLQRLFLAIDRDLAGYPTREDKVAILDAQFRNGEAYEAIRARMKADRDRLTKG